jgi:DNA-binding transcriptional regulator YiaG
MGSAVEIARGRELLRSGRGELIRTHAGVSRQEAAHEIGVDETTLWRWEKGYRVPRGLSARKYALLVKRLADVSG